MHISFPEALQDKRNYPSRRRGSKRKQAVVPMFEIIEKKSTSKFSGKMMQSILIYMTSMSFSSKCYTIMENIIVYNLYFNMY